VGTTLLFQTVVVRAVVIVIACVRQVDAPVFLVTIAVYGAGVIIHTGVGRIVTFTVGLFAFIQCARLTIGAVLMVMHAALYRVTGVGCTCIRVIARIQVGTTGFLIAYVSRAGILVITSVGSMGALACCLVAFIQSALVIIVAINELRDTTDLRITDAILGTRIVVFAGVSDVFELANIVIFAVLIRVLDTEALVALIVVVAHCARPSTRNGTPGNILEHTSVLVVTYIDGAEVFIFALHRLIDAAIGGIAGILCTFSAVAAVRWRVEACTCQ